MYRPLAALLYGKTDRGTTSCADCVTFGEECNCELNGHALRFLRTDVRSLRDRLVPMSRDNVIQFRARRRATPDVGSMAVTSVGVTSVTCAQDVAEMARYSVDIHGNITFGRLLHGLATVGLTVCIDPHSGRVLITDSACE